MPHKHKRKRDADDSNFNLAPITRARPLPAYVIPSVFTASEDESRHNKRRRSGSKAKVLDDTPKAFARMMAWQAAGKRPSGLDNGESRKRKKHGKPAKPPLKERKQQTSYVESNDQPEAATEASLATSTKIQILRGESLGDFARRVDQSMPLSSIPKSSTESNLNIPSDIKPQTRLTKHNKRLQRLISDWRTTDEKMKEKREEEDDDLEDEREEHDLLWAGVKSVGTDRKGKKKKSKGNAAGDDDPWKDLEKKRKEAKQKNLQDVVKAPPTLIKVRPKFKAKAEDLARLNGDATDKQGLDDGNVGVDVRDVPSSVGSLRQREEMGRKRREVIEGYRKLHGRKLKGKGLSMAPRAVMT